MKVGKHHGYHRLKNPPGHSALRYDLQWKWVPDPCFIQPVAFGAPVGFQGWRPVRQVPAKSSFTPLKLLAAATLLSLFAPLLPAQPVGYYDTADPSSPEALRQSLHEIIDDHQRFPYTSAATDTWDVLELADELQGDEGRIITLYRNADFAKWSGGESSYNREHVWPRSYGFPDNDATLNYPFTDMHSLFLTDPDYNLRAPTTRSTTATRSAPST